MRLPFLGLDATAWIAFAFAGNVACFAGRGILLMVMPQPMPPPVRACGALPHPLLPLSVPVLPHIAVTWVNVIAIGIDISIGIGIGLGLAVGRPADCAHHRLSAISRKTSLPMVSCNTMSPFAVVCCVCLCLPRLIACGLAVSKWCLGGVVYGVACGVSQTALQGACA